MQIMKVSNIGFKAKISPDVQSIMTRQSKEYSCKKHLGKDLTKKMQQVVNWGSDDCEIVTCKNPKTGRYGLGLKVPLCSDTTLTCIIENLLGKTEISQFLKLTDKHIIETEIKAKSLYRRFGLDYFERYKK